MTPVDFELSPPHRLAVAYARRDLRPALALLLAFDTRLAEIVGRATEPMIAQMKFAWWYDAISRESAVRPKGEPILRALGEVTVPMFGDAMTHLLDAWGILLAADEWGSDALTAFAEARSSAIFQTYAVWVGCADNIGKLGEGWAIADLGQQFGAKVYAAADTVTPPRVTKRKLRPLSILALSVASPSGARMIWHALTGR